MVTWLYALKGLIGLTLLVPLVLLPSQFIYPFIVPKILIFRGLVELMVACYVILWAGRPERYRPRWTPITIGIALWCASFSLSTVLGVDWYRSLWDTHERMLGAFTVLHYGAYAFICAQVVRGWAAWRALLRVLLVATSIIVGIAIYQKFGDVNYLFNRGQPRVASTLGHPSYLSGLGAFTALVGLLILVRDHVQRAKEAATGGGIFEGELKDPVAITLRFLLRHGIEVAAIVGGLAAVLLSETRGTLVGLGVAVPALAAAYAWLLRKRTDKLGRRGFYLATGTLVLIALSVIFVLVARNNDSLKAWAQREKIPVLRRMVTLDAKRGTLHTRLMAWEMGLEAGAEKPIVGWGPNNFYFAFNQEYRPEFLSYNHQETWFDNAHNVVVNTFAVQGGLGLLIYLFLCGAPVVLLWRGYRDERLDLHLALIGSAILVTHFVHNVAVFENPTSYLYFMLMLAFFESEIRGEKEVTTGAFDPGPLTPTIAVSVALVAVWVGNVEAAKGNMAGLDSIRAVHEGAARADRASAAMAALDRSEATLSPHVDGARNMFAEAVLKAVPNYLKSKRPEQRAKLGQLLERALAELGENHELHPLDVRVVIGRAKVAQQLWAYFPVDAPLSPKEVEAEIRAALALSPRRQELGYLLSDVLLLQKKFGAAIQELTRVRDDERSVSESWWRLARAYLLLPRGGGTKKAQAIIAEAEAAGVVFKATGAAIVKQIKAAKVPPPPRVRSSAQPRRGAQPPAPQPAPRRPAPSPAPGPAPGSAPDSGG